MLHACMIMFVFSLKACFHRSLVLIVLLPINVHIEGFRSFHV